MRLLHPFRSRGENGLLFWVLCKKCTAFEHWHIRNEGVDLREGQGAICSSETCDCPFQN